MSEYFKYDYFISRSGSDRDIAFEIAKVAKKLKKTYVMQDEDFLNGDNFVLKIHESLNNCRQIVALVSREYMKRDFCLLEISNAIYRDPFGHSGRLILFRLDDCELDGVLAARVFEDLRNVEDPATREFKITTRLSDTSESKLDLTPLYGIPPRSAHFVGRRSELGVLKEQLQLVRDQHYSRIVNINGPAGSGKRALIAELIEHVRTRIGGAVFCEANSLLEAQRGLTEFFSLSRQAVVAPATRFARSKEIISQISRALVPWILVLRNPKSPETLEFLTPQEKSLVLCLNDLSQSVNVATDNQSMSLHLSPLSQQDAQKLARLQAPDVVGNRALERLSDALRAIPGALALASRTLQNDRIDPDQLVDDILSRPGDDPSGIIAESILAQTADRNQYLKPVLFELGAFADGPIASEILLQSREPREPEAMNLLMQNGIVEREECNADSCYISVIFREALSSLLEKLDESRRQDVLRNVCSKLTECIRNGVGLPNMHTLKHVSAILKRVEKAGGPLFEALELYSAAIDEAVISDGDRGEFTTFLSWVIANFDSVACHDIPSIRVAYGHALFDAGNLEDALSQIEQAAFEAETTGSHLAAAFYSIEAGRIARKLNVLDNSHKLLIHAVVLSKSKNPLCLSDALEELAETIYADEGVAQDVLDCLREALMYRTNVLGGTSPLSARILRKLGSLYRRNTQWPEAERCLREACGIFINNLDDHPDELAIAEGEYARYCIDIGELAGADDLSRRAYFTAQDRLGASNPLTHELGKLRATVLDARKLTGEAHLLRQKITKDANRMRAETISLGIN